MSTFYCTGGRYFIHLAAVVSIPGETFTTKYIYYNSLLWSEIDRLCKSLTLIPGHLKVRNREIHIYDCSHETSEFRPQKQLGKCKWVCQYLLCLTVFDPHFFIHDTILPKEVSFIHLFRMLTSCPFTTKR